MKKLNGYHNHFFKYIIFHNLNISASDMILVSKMHFVLQASHETGYTRAI